MQMSFKPGILGSGALGAAAGLMFAVGLLVLLALPVGAQTANPAPGYAGDFERPYGWGYGEEKRAFEPSTRDANGNRVVLDGRIMSGDQSSLSMSSAGAGASSWAQSTGGAGFGGGALSGQAIGNQVNVITQGNYNTVIVTANQTNNGDQTAVLNGKLNLND